MTEIKKSEGLPFVKMMMLISSLSPLFIIIAIKGIEIIPDCYLWSFTAFIVLIPVLIIWWRIKIAIKNNDKKTLYVKGASQNKEYLFAYLLTVFLSFFGLPDSNIRDLWAVIFAIVIVLFIFWNMNIHYVNLIFVILGYRVYTIEGDTNIILLSTRHNINLEKLIAHRISNTVYIELKNFNYGT
jgi:hypothetical protein